MEIIIDGEIKNWSYDNDTTLQDLIRDINDKLLSESSKVISEIKLDDFDPSLDATLTMDKVTIEKLYKISFSTQTIKDQISGQISDALNIYYELKKSIPLIIKELSSENITKAMLSFKDCINGLIHIFRTIKDSESYGIVLSNQTSINNVSFSDFITKFNSTLNEIVDSMEKNDTTIINDFLEYELIPAIDDLGALLHELKEKSNTEG